jgi:hypothetical protein
MSMLVAWTGSAFARQQQSCLHDASETPDQTARRQAALGATRTVNNIQANQPGSASRQYFSQDQLAQSPFVQKNQSNKPVSAMNLTPGQEILPGWKLTLDLTQQGYWFVIKDTTDPCGFAYVSNQDGLIYKAEHLR